MSDIPGWLRGFQRARIPNVTTPSDHISLLDEANETAEEIHKAPSHARMSSCQNPSHPATAPQSAESHLNLNQVEQIWHNPDPDQMAETLKVTMMTQNSFDPLLVSYNSCVLHVLEAYHHMRRELLEKDREIQNREHHHQNEIKDFRQQELQWKRKEDEYKSELKKLKAMLAAGAQGLELVTLARSRSALNGTTRAGATESRNFEKESELQNTGSDEEPMMSDFAERKDSFLSASYTSQRRVLNARCNHCAPESRRPQRSEIHTVIGQPKGDAKYDNTNNNAHSDTTHSEQLHNMARNETSSSSLLGIEQEAERCTEQYARPLRNFVNNRTYLEQGKKFKDGSKPLPEIPISLKEKPAKDSTEEKDETRLYYGENLIGRSVTHHRGFSFIPGDDYGNLALGKGMTLATVLALNGFGTRGRPSSSYLPQSHDFIVPALPKKRRRLKPAVGGGRETNTVKERKLTIGCKAERTRSDLRTRIVTTVPDQSSKCSEYVEVAPGQLKPRRLSGSNETIIAVVHAITESGKIASRAS